jgi:RNA polymerase sigma-70 factor (ECF subfamily)
MYLRAVPTTADLGRLDDAALIDAVRTGDERALSALYDRHAPVVMGIAVRIVGDTEVAETVLLDTFTQVWNNSARYDATRASVASWLVMIARSRALDRLRSTARRERVGSISVDDAPDESLAAADLSSNPGQLVEARERRSAIAKALCALPDPQRIAVELAFFEGLSQSEIAERLAEPLGTVKTRIRLAMTKLRQVLGPHGNEALV